MLDLLLTCQFCLKWYGGHAVHEYRSKIIIKATTENTNDQKHACLNIFLTISMWDDITVIWMTSVLYSLMKQTLQNFGKWKLLKKPS